MILSESTEVLRQHKDILIVAHRLGFVMANAGADQSNVAPNGGDRVLLLPRDPDASCAALINDSFGRAWRNGVAARTGH